MATTVPEAHLDALRQVIERLERQPKLTLEQREELKQRRLSNFSSAFSVMLKEGKTLGQTEPLQSIYQLPEQEFFCHLKTTKDDMYEQVKTFDGFLDRWTTDGMQPPPYWTWRITVILRKAKLYDVEKRFLSAYFRHFWSQRGSSTDTKLGDRALKIGLPIPSAPESKPQPFE